MPLVVTHISRPLATVGTVSPVPAAFETSARHGQRRRVRLPRVRQTARSPCACTASPTRPTPGATSSRAGRRRLPRRGPVPARLRADGGTRRRPLPDGGARASTPSRCTRRSAATSDAVHHRPRLGRARPSTARPGTRPSAGAASSTMAVPPGGAVGHGLPANSPAQAHLVHVLLPAPAGRPASSAPTTSRSSTGCGPTGRRASTPTEDLALREAVAARPGQPGRRARLLPGHARRRLDGPGARRRCRQATQDVPPQPTAVPPRRRRRLHRRRGGRGGAVDGRPTTSRSRSSTAPATSSTSSSPRRSTDAIVEFLDARDLDHGRPPAARRPRRRREARSARRA